MQIIAIGGGGFSDGTDPGLDQYLLDQSRSASPRIGFIGTASGDSESYLLKFYARFARLDCRPGHLPLFRRTPDLESWVLGQDILYVGGGNTRSMLSVWEGWGLAPILLRAAEAGTVLAGISAGALCWFEWGVTDSAGDRLRPMACLGFLGGSCCPHYDGEAERSPSYEKMVEQDEVPPGYGIDDGAALHFEDGTARRVVIGRPGADVYWVSSADSSNRVDQGSGGSVPVRSTPVADLERVDVQKTDETS